MASTNVLVALAQPVRRGDRPAARRQTRARGARVRHLVLPGVELRRAHARRRDTVARFIARERWSITRLPTICVVNGQPLPRALWRRRRLAVADDVVLLSRPFGPPGAGGGLSVGQEITGIVALVALAALTVATAGGGAAALLGSGFASGTAGASLLAGGLVVGGPLLIHTGEVRHVGG